MKEITHSRPSTARKRQNIAQSHKREQRNNHISLIGTRSPERNEVVSRGGGRFSKGVEGAGRSFLLSSRPIDNAYVTIESSTHRRPNTETFSSPRPEIPMQLKSLQRRTGNNWEKYWNSTNKSNVITERDERLYRNLEKLLEAPASTSKQLF